MKKSEKRVKAWALVGEHSGEVYEVWPLDRMGETIAKVRQSSQLTFQDRKTQVIPCEITYSLPKGKK